MISKITSKYQVTIPRAIRTALKLEVADSLEWTIQDGQATVRPAVKPFLRYRAAIKVGAGSIGRDIQRARTLRGMKLS